MYFKSDYHEETALKLMQQFGFGKLEDSREVGSFCYVSAATNKYRDLTEMIDEEGIDLDSLHQKILFYSPSEMSLIRFGLQLFNSGLDDITLPEVIFGLDDENKKVVIDAIKFRFKI